MKIANNTTLEQLAQCPSYVILKFVTEGTLTWYKVTLYRRQPETFLQYMTW